MIQRLSYWRKWVRRPVGRFGYSKRFFIWSLFIVVVTCFMPQPLFAVVGQAEQFDEFKEEDLIEFHEALIREEKEDQMDVTIAEMEKLLEMRKDKRAKEGEEFLPREEIQALERELLGLPKRDRFRIGMQGSYSYDSNIQRQMPRREKGDSVYDLSGFTEFDLSGKKTDLRFEIRSGKQWNMHFPTSDFWTLEERLRYRRKYFKKIFHSIQSRLARASEKTAEIDVKKIRYDSFQNMAFNFNLARKLSLNTEFNANKRLFTTEPFDQDSSWEVTFAPSGFWNFTPKSRVSVGYKFGANRIRTKVGDSNAHEIHAGYFGRVTRKSSLSLDISFSHQTPRAIETPTVNTLTVGKGFIYQLTPKTQITLQFIRSLQNSTSNRVAGTENEATKEDTYYTNDSLSLSINSRLGKKLTAVLNLNGTHVRTKVEKDGDEDIETRQFSFPVSLTIDYLIKQWLRWTMSYTFVFRTGDEKSDTYRDHKWVTGINMRF